MTFSGRTPSAPLAALCLFAGLLLAPGWPARAQTAEPVIPSGPATGLRAVEDPLYGIRSVVPEAWSSLGQGIYARGTPPADPVLIALQSAAIDIETLWPALLPQLALADVPDATGRRPTEALDWTLYAFEVATPAGTLAVELALAEEERTTYLVLMQSEAAESGALRRSVFLPAVDAFAPLEPEPTPDPATLPYEVEGVSFPGGAEGVTLAGTLTRPRLPGPVPAIVLMSGSGPQDRDESLAPVSAIKPFALIADALTRAGIAVLRYDDRGAGGSSGDHEAATVADLTADGRAALELLAGREDIDGRRIGLLGHSEGGIYAASLAADDPRVAFVVGMAPPATDGISLLVAQYEAVARAEGGSEEDVEASRRYAQEVFPVALEGDTAKAQTIIAEAAGAAWDRQPEDARAMLGDREAFVRQQVEAQLSFMTSAWFRSFLAVDPAGDWRRVRVPVLGLFGGLDVQVVASQNEPALRAALAEAGNADVETVVLPDANHLFQAARTGGPSEYGSLEPAFTPDLLPQLTAWVVRRAAVRAE